MVTMRMDVGDADDEYDGDGAPADDRVHAGDDSDHGDDDGDDEYDEGDDDDGNAGDGGDDDEAAPEPLHLEGGGAASQASANRLGQEGHSPQPTYDDDHADGMFMLIMFMLMIIVITIIMFMLMLMITIMVMSALS